MKFKNIIKRVFLYFKRDLKECVALICAACIMVISFLTASYPAFAAAASWDDVSADAIALKNAYIDYFKSLSSGDLGDVLGGVVDIPISWLKTMSDGTLAISPVDDLYYYLIDGVLQFEDNREHRSGGGGGRRRGEATEIKPDLPVGIVKQINDYWSEYYKPHENASQYIWSYQSTGSTSTAPYVMVRNPPIYLDSYGGWGKKNWDSVYLIGFYKDDDLGMFYTTNYHHIYATSEGSQKYLHRDYYDLASGSLIDSRSSLWDTSNYPLITAYINQYCYDDRSVNYVNQRNYQEYMSNEMNFLVADSQSLGYFQLINYSQKKAIKDLLNSLSFTPNTNSDDDYGFILSSEPFELIANQTKFDYNQIPDNYTITINGDTIYDYDITNPDTGDHSTVNYYITNNYTLPDNGTKDDDNNDDPGSGSGSSSGTVSGNVTVGGKVDVSGKIEIDTKPIDININVNGGGSGSSGTADVPDIPGGVEFDQDVSLNNYYDWMQEQTTGFSGFMKNFFSWLPEPIVIMLCAGFALVILARFLGR